MINIESGVPIPKGAGVKGATYPFLGMKVGESFFVAAVNGEDVRKVVARVSNCASAYGKRHGLRFAVRRVEGGARCWRTA